MLAETSIMSTKLNELYIFLNGALAFTLPVEGPRSISFSITSLSPGDSLKKYHRLVYITPARFS